MELYEEFLKVTGVLNQRLSITPVLYGSLGLQRATNYKLNPEDIDILVPQVFLQERWQELQSTLASIGYQLVDENEHEFKKDSVNVGIAYIEDLKPFAGVDYSSLEITNHHGARFYMLSLTDYLKVYHQSLQDGYRRTKKNKKDQQKLELLGGRIQREDMLKELVHNWKHYCNKDSFIGIGSTRKAYRVLDYVIKVNLHPIGYQQSKAEYDIYQVMEERGLAELFAETYYVDEAISIQKYYKQVETRAGQSFEIDLEKDQSLLPPKYGEVLHLLDTVFDSFDLRDSSNYGLNADNKLIFIDYGMTKALYESEWVPLAEAGVLPQIYVEPCIVCGEEKELRMYGDDDSDKRCYECGKE
ncbi:hypothetical protein [Ornithinibacillus sp. JPR2-1]|uniref:hypothetical protein n=1 Tax=Ornithinibacillus sp. JPR2-1 TaxID=2094019 RepID=UPI0031CDC1E7